MLYIGTVLPLRLHFHSIAVIHCFIGSPPFFSTAPETWWWSVAQSITSREGNYVFHGIDGKADTWTWIIVGLLNLCASSLQRSTLCLTWSFSRNFCNLTESHYLSTGCCKAPCSDFVRWYRRPNKDLLSRNYLSEMRPCSAMDRQIVSD